MKVLQVCSKIQDVVLLLTLQTLHQHVDDAQQAFRMKVSHAFTLVFQLFEALYTAWKNRSKNPKFELFSDGLTAAMEKIEEYYEKTATSHAYTFLMCKLISFTRFWKLN